MKPLRTVPEEFLTLDERINTLRGQIEKDSNPALIGRAAAPILLDFIDRVRAFAEQLDLMLGYQLFASNLSLEENLPRANTAMRMYRDLGTMLAALIEGLLKCFGGTEVIGVQCLGEWAGGDQNRQKIIVEVLAAASRPKHSRK